MNIMMDFLCSYAMQCTLHSQTLTFHSQQKNVVYWVRFQAFLNMSMLASGLLSSAPTENNANLF